MARSTGYGRYEFTAFAEADLFGEFDPGEGDLIGLILDPLEAPRKSLEVLDQDPFLGRGNKCHQSLDGNGQVADHGKETQFFATHMLNLEGSDGNVYYLIEIEQEGNQESCFTFYGAVPPEDVTLTIAAIEPVTGVGVAYDELGAGLIANTASISGRYFCDTDSDDTDSEYEPGVAGVAVILVAADGTEIDKTTTDEDGRYSFDDVLAGDYRVLFELTPDDGKTLVSPNVGDDATDSDVVSVENGYGSTDLIVAVAGEEVSGVNAGVSLSEPSLQIQPEIGHADFFLI